MTRSVSVCWKWVAIDGSGSQGGGGGGGDGGGDGDERWAGVSPADEAALETGLRLAGSDGNVTVITVGPVGAESVLRDALAAGADHAIRIDNSGAADSASLDVASAIAAAAPDSDLFVCGDYSLDRGTGSMPAYLAARLGVAQALGLVHVADDHEVADAVADSPLRVIRRLDGGRREVLDVPSPAVISVEGSVARLRRAPLAAALRAKSANITVIPCAPGTSGHNADVLISAYRPRARALRAPTGSTLARVREILDIGAADAGHAETVTLEPTAAAQRIVDQLREWGYLDA